MAKQRGQNSLVLVMALARKAAHHAADKACGDACRSSSQPAGQDADGPLFRHGGSGAGCCAAVLCAHILPKLLRRGSRRVLFIATGALMSQTTFLQKESIPAVAHLVELTAPEKES